ncbi:AEC family transporter [Loigolactobacillus iwatensis]|uniref:AEC family transporter n=1 Tax=Loigolactobacillus iwatensis TaxID=1267156 RepID=UPI000F7F14F7|nr:AEC family transporter [Loigolactobacillus iwatensis]
MFQTLILALIPIIFTLGLGYFAAWRGTFDERASSIFVTLIMAYALPLSVFSGIWGTPRQLIIKDRSVVLWLLLAMVICYLVLFLSYYFIGHQSRSLAALRAMAVADPSVPFVGSAVLPLLFGSNLSAIDIGICSLIINLLALPVTIYLLESDQPAESHEQGLLRTFKKPLVWASLFGFVLVLAGSTMPASLANNFTLLGKAAGGVAIFAAGIVLQTRKIHLTLPVIGNVFLKNILFPLVVWGVLILLQVPVQARRLVVVTLAIPMATMPTVLAIQYQVAASEMASTQFLSTVVSFVTMGFFMIAV